MHTHLYDSVYPSVREKLQKFTWFVCINVMPAVLYTGESLDENPEEKWVFSKP